MAHPLQPTWQVSTHVSRNMLLLLPAHAPWPPGAPSSYKLGAPAHAHRSPRLDAAPSPWTCGNGHRPPR
eukprot:7686335-Pyramimonas_sp.AAC.1